MDIIEYVYLFRKPKVWARSIPRVGGLFLRGLKFCLKVLIVITPSSRAALNFACIRHIFRQSLLYFFKRSYSVIRVILDNIQFMLDM